jgi:hypothetical protein
MAAGDVFPAEMPDHPSHATLPLDDDTAERLLAGRLHPEDAPPGYAPVASLLRAAAGPPTPDELAGQEAALAMFRAERRHQGSVGIPRRPRLIGVRRRPDRVRSRVAALVLAGTLVAGGLWIADGARTALGLGSPSGGPNSGGPGSAGGSGPLRPAMGPFTGGRAPSLPSADRRATDRHGRAVTGPGSGPGHRVGPHGKPPKAKSPKEKPPKDGAGRGDAGKERPKAKPEPAKARPTNAGGGGGVGCRRRPRGPRQVSCWSDRAA